MPAEQAPGGSLRMKRHRVLPHPRGSSPDYATPLNLSINTDTTYESAWAGSSPPTLKHASQRIATLPPTPPAHSSHDMSSAALDDDVPATPTGTKSPPTPDVTPPRTLKTSARLLMQEFNSSRAESFRTAREHPPSSDEDEARRTPRVLPVRRTVGLGLGLGLGGETDVTSFDGEGTSTGTDDVERVWDDNLDRHVTVKKTPKYRLNSDGIPSPRQEFLLETPTPGATATQRDSPSPDRRWSDFSSQPSTVVEAFVVDTGPAPVKTLRHMKKRSGLRSASDSHVPRARAPDKHTSSVSQASAASRSRRKIWESGAIPVVVIPERRSSTKSSKTPSLRSTSSRSRRSQSVGSKPPLSRRGRSQTDSERTMDFPPTIPARRSSLSAPTTAASSRAGSRTGSLTAASLQAHDLLLAGTERDVFHGPSVTPFSTVSYETGVQAVVAEATAMPIFPQEPRLVQTTRPDADQTAVNSPLRNPRRPPAPPADDLELPSIAFIPATPSAATPHADTQVLCDGEPELDLPKRSMSLLRRAFRPRRNSEPSRSWSLTRRHQVDAETQTSKGLANPNPLFPTVNDQPPDQSRLHPFWRPAHFWDDLDDEDEFYDEDDPPWPLVDNRPPLTRNLSSRLKRTFAILPVDEPSRRRPASPRPSSPAARHRRHAIPGLGVNVEYVGLGGLRRRIKERRLEQRRAQLRQTISAPREITHAARAGARAGSWVTSQEARPADVLL